MGEPMKNEIQLFEDQKIRVAWDAEREEWYFSIVDVVSVLTDSPGYNTGRKYWNKLKQRLKDEGNELVTNCHQLKMRAADGKNRLTDVADTEQLLRIIQSIPSKKAEPFKAWLAMVGRAHRGDHRPRAGDRPCAGNLSEKGLFRGMGTSAAACHPHSQRADGRVEKARRQCRGCGEKSAGSRNRQACRYRAERRELPPACHGYCNGRGTAAGEDGGEHGWETSRIATTEESSAAGGRRNSISRVNANDRTL